MKRSTMERRLGIRVLWCALLLAACGGENLSPPSPQPDRVAQSLGSTDAGPPIQYAYDEARRLVAVYDSQGASAQYVYDEGGNILEIKRLAATDLGIFEFTPNVGPPGSVVTMTGTGFDPTPANNTVRINGVNATVSAASAQKLVVTVPAGATTGKLSVEAHGKTATSDSDFVVMAPAPAPVITGFTPVGGATGTKVTIAGTDFNPDLINNRVFIGNVQAYVVSATSTQLEATVSRLGATGRVRVSTPYGSATSTEDFMVLPTTELPSGSDTRMQPAVDGAPVDITLADATRKALLTFPVARGEQVSLVVTAVTLGGTASGSLRIYDSTGALVTNFSVAAAGGVFDLPAALQDGVWTAVLRPGNPTTGFSASLSLVRAATGTMEKDSAPTSFSGRAGQNARYTFSGIAGERLGLGVSSVSTVPASQYVAATVLKPDGSTLVNCGSYNAPGNCNLPVLPVTGTYIVLIDPPGTATASAGLLLSHTLEDTVQVDGDAVTFTTTRIGQDGNYSFTAGAGANLTLVLSGGTFANNATVRVFKPDGNQLTNTTAYPNQSYTLDFTAATAGTYAITIDPYSANTGQLSLRLVQEASGSAGTIDADATTVSLGAGQNGRYTFTGTAGDRLGLGVSSLTTVPASQYVSINVLKPDGSSLVSCGGYNAPGNCNLPVLPVTGTYSITMDPPGTATASVGLLLSRTLEDTVLVDGAAVTFNTS
ncbi:hypothetical protein DRW03_33505, partial [Corallococcus sp. H22C18031201]